MANQQVIPWNPDNDLSSNPSLKQAYASAVGSAAANRALELAAANKYAEENGDAVEKYSSLSERGGKMRKRRTTKRRKSRRKSRKARKTSKRRKI